MNSLHDYFRLHFWSYTVLLIVLVLLSVLFLLAWPNHAWQRVVILAIMLVYFVWGVVTHLKTYCITKRVVLEYLGVALLAGAMLWVITL